MTEDELAELLDTYADGRVRTHCDVCWKWRDHPACTVYALVAEVRRLRAERRDLVELLRPAFNTVGEGGVLRSWVESNTLPAMVKVLVRLKGRYSALIQRRAEGQAGGQE